MIVPLLLVCLGSTVAKTLPPGITKCSKSDLNLNACLDKYVMEDVRKLATGNKELGISRLEPLFLQEASLGDPKDPNSLKQLYKHINIYGITGATIKNSRANFTHGNCYWNYDSFTPMIRMESDYKMNGKLLIFTLNGQGRCNNMFYDIDGQNMFKCERYMKKGKIHLRMTDHVFKFKPKRVVFDYNNFIDGNEQLSKEILRTLNENALKVYDDFGTAIEQIIASVWVQNINEVFGRVPEDELFLP